MGYTFKPITDPESLTLLLAARLLWYRNEGSPTYMLLPASYFDFKALLDGWVSDGATFSEDGKLCWPNGRWWQYAIRVEE